MTCPVRREQRDEISIFAYICAQRSAVEYPTFDFLYKKLKILPFMVTNVGKDGTFPEYSCFSTMDSFRFEEIVSGNGAFQEI